MCTTQPATDQPLHVDGKCALIFPVMKAAAPSTLAIISPGSVSTAKSRSLSRPPTPKSMSGAVATIWCEKGQILWKMGATSVVRPDKPQQANLVLFDQRLLGGMLPTTRTNNCRKFRRRFSMMMPLSGSP
jgi:hypothetical protein